MFITIVCSFNNLMIKKFALLLISFITVTWGQPGVVSILGIIASGIGYALFFWAIDGFSAKRRFLSGLLFFTLVQLVQLSWFLSHPYAYIYGVWILLSLLIGAQFGLLALFATSERIRSFVGALSLSCLWVILEWMRLYLFTGFTFNPIGLHLACTQASLQSASFAGILGMSFLVIFSNALTC